MGEYCHSPGGILLATGRSVSAQGSGSTLWGCYSALISCHGLGEVIEGGLPGWGTDSEPDHLDPELRLLLFPDFGQEFFLGVGAMTVSLS